MIMSSYNHLKVIWEEFRERKVLKVAVVYALMAWGVMQVGELLFDALQLPPGSYSLLVILVLLGFPMALVLAWAYEITPDGVRRDVVSDLAHHEKTRDLPVGLAPSSLAQDTPCIAILPFRDMTPEQDESYFCEGLAEEIQTALCKIEKLNVISRAHSVQFGGAEIDINKVARELHVCAAVEGSVRRSNGDIRVSVQLVDARSGIDLWSQSFDFHQDGDFDIQQEIAHRITESIKVSLVQHPQGGYIDWDPLAYDHFLKGMRFFRRRSARNTEYAREMFEKAIEQQACYGRAWAGVAYTYGFEYLNFNHAGNIRRKAIRASKRAMKLNSGSPEAHVARGIVKITQNKPIDADKAFDIAVAIEPENFEAWYFNACNWARKGECERAIRLFDRAAGCDEQDYQSVLLQSQLYVSLGDQAGSKRVLKTGLARANASLAQRPNDYRALNIGALAYLQLGECELAQQWMSRSLQNAPQDAILEYNAACFYALSGDFDRSLVCLRNCRNYGALDNDWLNNDSNLDEVRALPAFKALTGS
jgi:adenylate cyclase